MPRDCWMHIQNNCFKILLGENGSTIAEPQMPEVRENISIIQTPHVSATFWRSLAKKKVLNLILKVMGNLAILTMNINYSGRSYLFKYMGLGKLYIHLEKTSLASYLIIYSETAVPPYLRGIHCKTPNGCMQPRIELNSTYVYCFCPIHTYL